jgi:hypothetical protein
MSHKINYDDNIFFLILRVKLLKDGLKLDLHKGLFLNNYCEDIFFIAETIRKISDALKNSPLLVGRLEHGKNLSRLEKQFAAVLTDILRDEKPWAQAMQESFEHLKKILYTINNDLVDLKSMLAEVKTKSEDDKYIISEEEYKVLLFDEEQV